MGDSFLRDWEGILPFHHNKGPFHLLDWLLWHSCFVKMKRHRHVRKFGTYMLANSRQATSWLLNLSENYFHVFHVIPQTSVSTGSVSSNPPVKVSWTNTLLMLTQLTLTSPIQAPMWRQSVGMTLDLKTNFLIVKNVMRNSFWIKLMQCTFTTLTRLVTTVSTAASISQAVMRCTQFTLGSVQHLAMAIQDAPACIHRMCRSSPFVCVDSLWPYWCQSVAT